ncbi:sorbosone dehydrogenase family protein [Psychrobacillus sp. FJAT-21963]|uniref:PQQ-dependent sugar dehydrogenase n=1 Tax=Psychrobacillus sp. FJAT-21963 TaxID=1712028 RepID=UPI0006F53F73|nr:PQQ-dependent sugar dehydrogenase [Psychrobacillus sp. FJAT-21963]KQL35213.1 quinoprotein glucose dehydrogenase [Psychrobacillus sp. FJAT-21963]
MKRLILLSLILFGCTNEPISDGEIIAEKVATNLDIPWAINQHVNTFYISERVGRIAKVTSDGNLTHEEVVLSDNLSDASEAGLLGFVLKNDFIDSQEAYAYYTYDENGESFNRVVTIKLENDMWRETAIHLDGIPTGNIHHGGRLEIGPDGLLYITIGDAGNPQNAQDPSSLNGKIVRMKEDGTFEIYTTGHRNPQGLAWDKEGKLYEAEHGQSANDEVNLIEQGKNYGYPIIEGTERRNGYVTPIVTSGANETWAPSGISFHKGKLYVATLRGEAIKVIDVSTGEVERSITGFGRFGRIRDVYSDGESLYFVTNNTDGRGSPREDDDVLYRLIE